MKILFVCVGNTCRSPLAEGILKQKTALAGLKKVKVRSCGISAENGAPANPFAVSVASENGVDLSAFKTQKLNKRLMNWADVVICMTPQLKKNFSEDKVTDFTDLYALPSVTDPYGGDMDDYRQTYYSLNFACELLVKDLLNAKTNKK